MPKIYQQEYRHQRSQNKAQQILEGALPEFLKYGYARTSMDRIANSAGVSKQTLYSYYKDKEGLFTALVKHITCQKFQLVCSQPLIGEPRQVLKELANDLLTEIRDEEYLNFIRLIVAESGIRADLSQLFLSNLFKPAVENLTRYFQTRTQLNFRDLEATAITFIGSLIYYIFNQELLHGKEIMSIDSDRYVDNLIELVLNDTQQS